jgi:hypothetical protein
MNLRGGRIDWAKQITKHRQSGLPVKEYCRLAGFSSWSFYTNRKRLQAKAGYGAKALMPFTEPVSFVRYGSLPVSNAIRICFSDGTRVECDAGLGIENLSKIISSLKPAFKVAVSC